MEIDQATAFTIPNGAIRIETSGSLTPGDKTEWKALDIHLIRGEMDVLLCSIEFDAVKGLRTFVWDEINDEPVFIWKTDIGTAAEPEEENDDLA